MTTVRVIGIMGFAGSGKDTLAEMFRSRVGGKIFKFATKLTELALRLNPMIRLDDAIRQEMKVQTEHPTDRAEGTLCISYGQALEKSGSYDAAKRNYQYFRPMLVNIGQGMRDVFGNNFWVEHTMRSIDEAAKQVDSSAEKAKTGVMYAMITDVRYPNECEAILSRGGIILHIKRTGVGAANQTEAQSIADSEKYVNIVVNNNTTLEELEGKCEVICQVLEHLFDK